MDINKELQEVIDILEQIAASEKLQKSDPMMPESEESQPMDQSQMSISEDPAMSPEMGSQEPEASEPHADQSHDLSGELSGWSEEELTHLLAVVQEEMAKRQGAQSGPSEMPSDRPTEEAPASDMSHSEMPMDAPMMPEEEAQKAMPPTPSLPSPNLKPKTPTPPAAPRMMKSERMTKSETIEAIQSQIRSKNRMFSSENVVEVMLKRTDEDLSTYQDDMAKRTGVTFTK